MALLFIDGFDHYGTDENNLLGVYAQASGTGLVLGAPPGASARTGLRSLAPGANSGIGDNTSLRRLVNTSGDIFGVGFALWLENLPSDSDALRPIEVRTSDNQRLFSLAIRSDGAIRVFENDNDVLIVESESTMQPGVWNHIEAKFDLNTTSPTVAVRLNGESAIPTTALPVEAVHGPVGNIAWDSDFQNPVVEFWIDDLYAWDGSGSQNNDWLGDRRVLTILPNGNDPAFADYTSTGGNGFDTIAEDSPDGDTSFIEFDTDVGDAGQFDLEDVPEDLSSIAGIQTYTRMKKLDSGEANVQVSLENQGSLANGIDRAITTDYAYWQDVFETNPRLGVPWTPVEFNAAKVRFTRTA